MILVIGHLKIAPEKIAGIRKPLQTMIAATRQEAGCLLYAFAEDVSEPGVLRIVERWENWETLAAHGAAPHMATWRAALEGIEIVSREVIAYEAGKTKPL